MRHTEKKQIKLWLAKVDSLISEYETLKAELEEIRQEHEDWMSERDSDTDFEFSNTPTGERASEEYDVIETATNDLDDAFDSLNDAVEPVRELMQPQ